MSAGELIVSRENGPLVALGMTDSSFDGARREGVMRIETDPEAVQSIARFAARQLGQTDSFFDDRFPMVAITRDASKARNKIMHWDDFLPIHQGSPNTGHFFAANQLDSQNPPTPYNREKFVGAAKEIGAPALTEISIPSWRDRRTHAANFAAGLLRGQRPLDLPRKPSLLGKAGNFFNNDSPTLGVIHAVQAMADRNKMPAPFLVTYHPDRPEIEG